MCYFQLCSENYHWWWRAFLTSGCCSVYVFAVHGGGVDDLLPHYGGPGVRVVFHLCAPDLLRHQDRLI